MTQWLSNSFHIDYLFYPSEQSYSLDIIFTYILKIRKLKFGEIRKFAKVGSMKFELGSKLTLGI